MTRLLPAVLAITVCLGCGKSDGIKASVQGKVSLDGTPVENGSIMFVSTTGTKGPFAGGAIENGHYAIPADKGMVAGRYRVEIHVPRGTGKKIEVLVAPGAASVEKAVEAAPTKYNTKSKLEEKVVVGSNSIDFDLKSR